MLASQIASRVFAEIRAAAGEDATKRYLDNIYVGFDDARGGFADAAAGAERFPKGSRTRATGQALWPRVPAPPKRRVRAREWAAEARPRRRQRDGGRLDGRERQRFTGRRPAQRERGCERTDDGAKKLAVGAQSADAGAASLADGATSLAAGALGGRHRRQEGAGRSWRAQVGRAPARLGDGPAERGGRHARRLGRDARERRGAAARWCR